MSVQTCCSSGMGSDTSVKVKGCTSGKSRNQAERLRVLHRGKMSSLQASTAFCSFTSGTEELESRIWKLLLDGAYASKIEVASHERLLSWLGSGFFLRLVCSA